MASDLTLCVDYEEIAEIENLVTLQTETLMYYWIKAGSIVLDEGTKLIPSAEVNS